MLFITLQVTPICYGKFSANFFAAAGNLEAVKRIADENLYNWDFVGESGVSALHLACYYGHVEVARFLLDVTQAQDDNNLRSPLYYACLGGSLECVKLFVTSMDDAHKLSAEDSQGGSPLQATLNGGHKQ